MIFKIKFVKFNNLADFKISHGALLYQVAAVPALLRSGSGVRCCDPCPAGVQSSGCCDPCPAGVSGLGFCDPCPAGVSGLGCCDPCPAGVSGLGCCVSCPAGVLSVQEARSQQPSGDVGNAQGPGECLSHQTPQPKGEALGDHRGES